MGIISNKLDGFALSIGDDPAALVLWIFSGLISSGYFITLNWLENDPSFFFYFLMVFVISIPPFFAYSIKFRKLLPKRNSREVKKVKVMLAASLTFMITSGLVDLNFLMSEGSAKLPGVTLGESYPFWHELGVYYFPIMPVLNFLGVYLSVRALKIMNIPSPAFPTVPRSH